MKMQFLIFFFFTNLFFLIIVFLNYNLDHYIMKQKTCFGKLYLFDFYYEINSLRALNAKIIKIMTVHFQKKYYLP